MKPKGITLFVEDIQKAVMYYTQLFSKEPDEKQEKSATFMFDTFRFFIHEKLDQQEGFPPSEDHTEFEVEDVDEEVKRLKSLGFALELEPHKYYWGYSTYLRDPEGKMIELTGKKLIHDSSGQEKTS